VPVPITLAIAGCWILAAVAALLGRRRNERRLYVLAAILAAVGCLLAVVIAVGLSAM
jgi:predicted PurR-regulated permease PerM